MHFVNENFCIIIKFSLQFVKRGQINTKSALVQVMPYLQYTEIDYTVKR